jgi:mannose-6-phosphate isomerase
MLSFTPLYKPLPWGGRRLAELFGRRLPEGPVGESWELVELPDNHNRVRSASHDEALVGASLGDLWRRGALGGSAQGAFPFLLKWIDAAAPLSVQVHPDEATCARSGKGKPKTEAWYMVERTPGANLLMGHHAGLDAATLAQAAAGGSLPKWLHEIAAEPGDIYLLRAGTLHAIGAGCLLLEVQQPSDTTYRVYDWGRVGLDGQPRQLHLSEAIEATDFGRHGPPKRAREGVDGPCFALRILPQDSQVIAKPLRVLAADRGPTVLQTERGQQRLERGDVVVAEPADGVVRVLSGSAVLLTEPHLQ